MAKVFITGGTGQVGGWLVESLLHHQKLGVKEPKDIICLVRSPKKATRLQELGVQILQGDLMARDKMAECIKTEKIEFVFHIAALVSPSASYENLFDPNVLGTENILHAFGESEAKAFVFTSSIAVYANMADDSNVAFIDEESPVLDWQQKEESYAITKRHSEFLVKAYAERFPNKKLITIRLGNVIGPGDRITLPSLVKVMGVHKIPKLVDRGKGLMSITPALDVANAQVFLAECEQNISGEVYNITGHPSTYKEIFSWIAEYYDVKPPRAWVPKWLFGMFKPLLRLMRKILKNNHMIQEMLSPTALNFMGKEIHFSSEKIETLGFEYQYTAREAIIVTLQALDPEKKLVTRRKKNKNGI
jgi:plant 3beta-hydroxysteroid-4alpha-carboxylate 3-dehydrogenase